MVAALTESLTLSNGNKMPIYGLGTWLSAPDEVKIAVRTALDNGIRLIDTAACYQNEKEIGEVLAEYFESGKLTREDIFLTTKLWCSHTSPKNITGACQESLKKLGLTYVDLYLVHAPTAYSTDFKTQDHSVKVEDTWAVIEQLYDQGLAKAIGVSNFSDEQIDRIMKVAKTPIHNSQVEAHIYWPQQAHLDNCKKHNITVTAYSPIGSPGRVKCDFLEWAESPLALEDASAVAIAKKHGKEVAQVLLRHLIQRGFAVIPKSINPKRIVSNSLVFDFTLTDEEVETLNKSTHRQRLFLQNFMIGHPEDGFISERK
uniref:Aldo_ket_red domain-containing protein n=1 Tax=Rhabditophanes sp. KR3021 TaxID=114890 RepID=A0AC35TZY7_9BILA